METLHEIVRAADSNALASQLESGAPVDARDDNDRTPLMTIFDDESASNDAMYLEMARLLLMHGADSNAIESENGYTVLALAVQNGTLSEIELLLEAGADATYQREYGYDVLIDAMHSRTMQEKQELWPVIELLLAHGAPLHGESDWGESALSVASQRARFDVVGLLLQAGADAEILEWTPLMRAIALGSVEDVAQSLRAGADLQARDNWERTPLLLSLATGETEKAALLLEAGSDLNERARCEKTALMCAIDSENPTLIAWLLTRGADVDAKDEFGNTALMEAAANGDAAIVRLLIDGGADIHLTDAAVREKLSVTEMMDEMGLELDEESRANLERADSKFGGTRGETAIVKANSLDVVHLLVAAGAELGDINDEMRAALTGLESEGEINCSPEDYRAGQQRRFGNSNPEVIDNAFWQAMVRSGATASGARGKFGDDENYGNGPIWCFHRFGKSITQLPDGRIIEVGGEHEDWYDPDFCIYNEVFVHHGGGRFEIFAYPADIFSPTDFHSATLVGEVIYIIGCLGYPEARRSGETPVYRLHCETMEMESVATSGDKPGWVSRHKALHTPDETIHISGGNIFEIVDDEEDYRDNTDEFSLDLSTMIWSRVEDLL